MDAIIYSKLLESSQQAMLTDMATSESDLIQLCACLFLSAKVNEFELVKIRDIINVVQFTMNQAKEPASITDLTQDGEDSEMMDEQARHKQLLA